MFCLFLFYIYEKSEFYIPSLFLQVDNHYS